MPILRILNPANGKPVASLPADDVRSIKAKYAAARSAHPRWSATPLKHRRAALVPFRAAVVPSTEEPAPIRPLECRTPIDQPRTERKGVS